MKTRPGSPHPLGAIWDGHGVNFALFSENAAAVELCLYTHGKGHVEAGRVALHEQTDRVWHVYVPGLGPGQRYGYRVDGPYEPLRGHRFNRHKLLIDPYARAIDGHVRWNERIFGYTLGHPDADLSFDARDSAHAVPKSVVVAPEGNWALEYARAREPWSGSPIYELHVKGFTIRHPEVPADVRGKYSGLASPPVIDYLKSLGITSVELMPIHQFVSDGMLQGKGLKNFWGYSTIGFFAPDVRYAAGRLGEQVAEFRAMVERFHAAGIEVILDVVYNHTAEGNQLGPTICFRGIDNASYYRLLADNPRYYMDYTGTGNTLNVRNPRALQLIMDSLRYWILEMKVDGFRFDLASALARELHDVDRLGSFFDIIGQDPVISRVKLIAEPWDVGEGGYQVGNFPPLWSEWNGKYRDTVRDYWRGAQSSLGEFAFRFTGSSDLYEATGRRPFASINFVTAHDGFTLHDLVSYNQKHNEANGEGSRDGESHNRSWNLGVEGPTGDARVVELRARQKRNFLATLMLSQGVPMLLAGDELGRSQRGNNNAYCQDNEISWLDWSSADPDLLQFTRGLLALRREHPVFRRRRWFHGRPIHGSAVNDIAWFAPGGQPMSEDHWAETDAKALGVFLIGHDLGIDSNGDTVRDDTFGVLFNARHEAITFTLPDEGPWGLRWQEVLDTRHSRVGDTGRSHRAGAPVEMAALSLVVLRRAE